MNALERLRTELAGDLAAEYDFESRAFDQEGVLQHYLDEGPRSARPIVFVHGNPSWSCLWRAPIRALRSTRRCIAPDHIGMGLSEKPADYPYVLARHAANLERLLLALELRDITLVVHDWGGPIGLSFAARHRERVAELVITNTAAFTGLAAPWRIRVCRTPILGALAVRGLNAFARAATNMAVVEPMSERTRALFTAPYPDWQSRVAIQRFIDDIPLSPRDASWSELIALERQLPSLAAIPTTILWGERDFCFTTEFRDQWTARFPRARLVNFANAGHYLLEDAAAAATAEIARAAGARA